jgi:hypothetical protein
LSSSREPRDISERKSFSRLRRVDRIVQPAERVGAAAGCAALTGGGPPRLRLPPCHLSLRCSRRVSLRLIPAARSGQPVRAAHTRYYEGTNRGYVRCRLTPREWRSDYRAAATDPATTRVLTTDAPVFTQASWVVHDGRPGAVPA